MYAGRTLLGYKDKEVMQLTPRFLWGQLAVHYDVQSQMWGGKSKRKADEAPTAFIDQIQGWE